MPEQLTAEEKSKWLASLKGRIIREQFASDLMRIEGVSIASDAFFPFRDNIDQVCIQQLSYA